VAWLRADRAIFGLSYNFLAKIQNLGLDRLKSPFGQKIDIFSTLLSPILEICSCLSDKCIILILQIFQSAAILLNIDQLLNTYGSALNTDNWLIFITACHCG